MRNEAIADAEETREDRSPNGTEQRQQKTDDLPLNKHGQIPEYFIPGQPYPCDPDAADEIFRQIRTHARATEITARYRKRPRPLPRKAGTVANNGSRKTGTGAVEFVVPKNVAESCMRTPEGAGARQGLQPSGDATGRACR